MKYSRFFLKKNVKKELNNYKIGKKDKKKLYEETIEKYNEYINGGLSEKEAYENLFSLLMDNLKNNKKINKSEYRFSFVVFSYALFSSIIITLSSLGYPNVIYFLRTYYLLMLVLSGILLIFLCFSPKNRSVYNVIMTTLLLCTFLGLNILSFKYFFIPYTGHYDYYLGRNIWGKLIYEVYDDVLNRNSSPNLVSRKFFYDPTLIISLFGFFLSFIMMKGERGKLGNDCNIN